MPCPHGDQLTDALSSRRDFLKRALAVGGASALSACVSKAGEQTVSRGTSPDDLPERLFAWNNHLPRGPHGSPRTPGHQVILFLRYEGEGIPTASERSQVDAALRTLERAYTWGVDDEEFNPTTAEGLLYLMGYSRAYFDRFDDPLPESAAVKRPDDVIQELDEDATADTHDAALLLTSDSVQTLLTAEMAITGELDELNGVPVTATFSGVFSVEERRTGFLGAGRPAEELDVEAVPENSPTAMGYRSSFADNQASESKVSIPDGPFADGTTMQTSRLVFDLDSWYDNDESSRIDLMFSPRHTKEDVGEFGEELAGKSQILEETVRESEEIVERHGRIGHTMKTAAARDDDFNPILLRRSEGVSTDLDEPAMNFLSVHERIQDFVETRRAMNGAHVDADVAPEHDGIQSYVDVTRRGTFLVPPRSRKALPTPTGD